MKTSVMREFIRLTETKNYTKTAEELYIAQSVLSRHIVGLEEELGCQLINRSKTIFELTPAGEIVQEEFRKILLEHQNMLDRLSRLSEGVQGELQVGVLYYDYDCYVAKIREAFHAHYPGVRLVLHSYQPAQLEKALLDGTLDVGLFYSAAGTFRKDLAVMPFLKVPIAVLFDKNHPLAKRKDIRIADLAGGRLLYPREQLEITRTAGIVEELFARSDTLFSQKIPFDNFDEVPYLLREFGAVYITAMANINAYRNMTECRFLEPEALTSDVSAVWLRKNQNPSVRLFLSAIKICFP